MSWMDSKSLRQRTSGVMRFMLAAPGSFLFIACSRILNDLPEPGAEVSASGDGGNSGSSAGGRGGENTGNGGGKSGGGGSLGSGSGGESAGGVAAGGTPAPVGSAGEGGNNATPAGGTAPTMDGGNGGTPTCADSCDCDGDGSLNDDCHTGGGPADCDDGNDQVWPGQDDWF